MDNITSSLKSFYSKTFSEHGANAKGVNWGTKDKAELRHAVMTQIMEKEKDAFSLLDVGCGYGEFYSYLCKKFSKFKYYGIDVVPEMIEHAKAQYDKNRFACIDIFSQEFTETYDYVICNGILTQKLHATDDEMTLYMEKLITKMMSLAKKGIAFNVMSSLVDFKNENLFYISPSDVFNLCTKYSRHILIDHSYPLYEFTTFIYKTRE